VAALDADIGWRCHAGGTEDQGRRWQPYTDFLVGSVLMALPWGGPDLAQSAPADLDRLFGKVATMYLSIAHLLICALYVFLTRLCISWKAAAAPHSLAGVDEARQNVDVLCET
jgi:hypothetical protein